MICNLAIKDMKNYAKVINILETYKQKTEKIIILSPLFKVDSIINIIEKFYFLIRLLGKRTLFTFIFLVVALILADILRTEPDWVGVSVVMVATSHQPK